MKPALSRIALAALAAPALLVACGDGGGGGNPELYCELKVLPSIVSHGVLCLEGEKEDAFNVQNSGSAECVVDLALGGTAPQHFGIGSTHLVIPVGETVPVTAKYHPTVDGGAAAGQQHEADVTITSNAKEAEPFVLKLKGETAATETKAILSLSCPPSVKKCGPTVDPSESCCRVVDQTGNNVPPYYGRSYLTSIEFGAIQTGRTVTLPLQVTNLGCGQLDVSSLTITPTTGQGFCDPASVNVMTQLPVSVAGSVSAADRKSATIEVQFTPTELCSYFGGVTVATNDPDIATDPMAAAYNKFNVMGSGTEGRIRTDPTAWYFGDVGTGETVEKVFTIVNVGNREAEITGLALRNGPGVYQITKIQRPECPEGSGFTDLGTSFTLAGTDQVSNCGADQANVTVAFTPNGAGNFENKLDANYGDGVATIPLTGSSNPTIEIFPPGQVLFFGPKTLGCQPLSCSVGDLPNGSCSGVCDTDDDCHDGALCIGGICAAESSADNGAVCTDTCGQAERVVRICNAGHAPLKFDDAAQGGGIVITGRGGRDNPPPMHRPSPGIDDPARNNTPVFSILQNGCADSAGNGKSLLNGECCEAVVGFLDTRNGGSPTGTAGLQAELHVYTNDPTYPRDLSDGTGPDIRAWTDPDFDPVAGWVAYDVTLGPGELNGPRMNKMAVLDAAPVPSMDSKGSYDPACDWNDPGCDKTKLNPIVSYEWELVAVSGTGAYVNAMVGPIDLDNPNARCPSWINNGNCFEVVDLTPKGKVIRFFADGEAPRNYEFKLTVKDGVCSPSHQGVLQQTVQVGS